jgi:hypothetical protein
MEHQSKKVKASKWLQPVCAGKVPDGIPVY